MTKSTQARVMVSPEEAAAMFGYASRNAFLRFAREAGIPHIRINARVIRFRSDALDRWIDKHTIGAGK